MSFGGFFRKKENGAEVPTKKNYLDIPENMYDKPFSTILASIDHRHVEDAVASHFKEILSHRTANDFKYLKLYPRWHRLFLEHFHEVCSNFADNGTIDDFKIMLREFPEITYEIYEFLLEEYLSKDEYPSSVGKDLSLVDDLLIPMSDVEKMFHPFECLRKYDTLLAILDETDDFEELFDVLQVLEQYFDIPRGLFANYLEETYAENFDALFPPHVVANDFETIRDMFKDKEAYDYIMTRLPALMSRGGISAYNTMVQLLGRNSEVENARDYCQEFITDEQYPPLVGDNVLVKAYTNDSKNNPQMFLGKITKTTHRGITIVRTPEEKS